VLTFGLSLNSALRELSRRFAQINGSRLGDGLESRSNIDDVAHDGGSAVVHFTNHRQAAVEADAELRTSAKLAFKIVRRPPDAINNAQGGPASPDRRVLVGNWRTENRHDAVAREVLDRAAMLAHDVTG
jgi:hypothetical protein